MSTPLVLFVCVHNAGRSVMAEALLNARAAGRAHALSAGTRPQEAPHPEVVAALQELELDVSSHRGRLLDDTLVERAARVITMGCAVESGDCPAILYADVEDWALEDPKGRPLDEVRRIRDDIAARVDGLLEEIAEPQA